MTIYKYLFAIAGVLVLGISLGALAGFPSAAATVANGPAEAIRDRKAHFADLEHAMRDLRDELNKQQPAPAVLAQKARVVKLDALDLPNWFPPGSGSASGENTRAEDVIWQDPSAFKQAAVKLQGAAGELERVVGQGNPSEIRDRLHAAGAACQDCHDQFRRGWLW